MLAAEISWQPFFHRVGSFSSKHSLGGLSRDGLPLLNIVGCFPTGPFLAVPGARRFMNIRSPRP